MPCGVKRFMRTKTRPGAAVDALCVCVSVPAPKPKAFLALELISDCRLAWTPEGHLFRCHLWCEQAGALDEVGEAAGWTWGGQPGLQVEEDVLGRPWAWGVDPSRHKDWNCHVF